MTMTADFVTNTPVPFARLRYLLQEQGGGVQEGVVGGQATANDWKVTQRGAGANQTVDVQVGGAWVQIDTGTRNGLVHCFNDAVFNAAVTAAHATLPRIDQVVLQYNDSSIPTGVGGDIPTIRVIAGTPTSGATLANRTGAAALPSDALRLADLLVPAASVSVVTANINDRRPWARGAYHKITRLANAAAGVDYTTVSTTAVAVDATNLGPRIECSGMPFKVTLTGQLRENTANQVVVIGPQVDGAAVAELGTSFGSGYQAYAVGAQHGATWAWNFTPTAGSHLISLAWFVSGGSGTLAAAASAGAQLVLEEMLRQNANNN